MPYHLSSADIAPPAPLSGPLLHDAGQTAWWRAQLPAAAGACFIDSLRLAGGLSLAYSHYTPARELRESSSVEREHAVLSITVALQGQSATCDAGGQRFDFLAGHSTLAAFASVRGERHFPPQQPIRQLRLMVEEPLLHQYGLDSLTRNIHPGHSTRLACAPSSAATQHLSDTLLHLRQHAGCLLDVQIAALSLLSEQTRHLLPAATARTNTRRAHEQEKIARVRDILHQQFGHPLTLAYLCKTVGTNECTLKQGFRAVFGTSVHRMLTAIRMQKARELLETGLPVSSVAWRVGYRHPASFSSAFARYWGRTPKVFLIKK